MLNEYTVLLCYEYITERCTVTIIPFSGPFVGLTLRNLSTYDGRTSRTWTCRGIPAEGLGGGSGVGLTDSV